MQPSVSIIIPCYNKRAYVAATIESALAQTHRSEIIVVDDGSTDGSLDEIKRFDGHVKWVTGPNRGGCAARNTGAEMASGEYLQFLDADDILPPDKIARQLAALSDAPEGSVAFCPWRVLHDDGRIDAPDPRPYWKSYDQGIDFLLDMWLHGGFFPTHPWLVPRTLAEASGPWNTELAADQDGEYFGRLLTLSGPALFCTDTDVQYRSPPEGAVSRDKSRRAGESRLRAFDVVAERILALRNDRAARRACLSRIRKTAYALREFDDMVARADVWERRLSVFDFSPSLPPMARGLVGLLGIKRGLRARALLKS
ncbi:glycosyltransferase family A protein [Antarctobacter jejuensis]|uniref:glycosyltransferase family A protein n=1 Tax=Antarctobacter jejuensis TaxID=1439938 RepID=UPI003FD6A2CB